VSRTFLAHAPPWPNSVPTMLLALVQWLFGGAVDGLLAAATAIGACAPKEASTIVVGRRDVRETAVASGRVVAPARIEVGVVSAGVVAEVKATEGQTVKVGDVLQWGRRCGRENRSLGQAVGRRRTRQRSRRAQRIATGFLRSRALYAALEDLYSHIWKGRR